MRRAPAEAAASRNPGPAHERRANSSLTAARTGVVSVTSTSTEPPNPPPIIRAPSAPASTAARRQQPDDLQHSLVVGNYVTSATPQDRIGEPVRVSHVR
jgi:hypothetical protein